MGFSAISLIARFCSLPAGEMFPAGQPTMAAQMIDLQELIGNEPGRRLDFSLSFPVRQGNLTAFFRAARGNRFARAYAETGIPL